MYSGRDFTRKSNPREDANIFSIFSFFFTLGIFKIGNKRELQEDDVYEIMSSYQSQRLGDRLEDEWKKELKKNSETPSLIKAIFRLFGIEYMYLGLIGCFFKVTDMIIKPIAIGKLVHYFTADQSDMTLKEAYFYGAILVLGKFVFEIGRHNYTMYVDQIGIKIRTSVCSLIYRKCLRVNELSTDDTSAGKVMTLISKDIDLFDLAVYFGHDLWVGFVETAIMAYMIYRQLGWESTASGLGFLLATLPIQIWIGQITMKARYEASERTDKRLSLLQEIFNTIKLIKIYTWDKYFITQGILSRRREMNKIRSIFYLKAIVISIGYISSRFSFYICMVIYMYLGNYITAEKAFVVIACYNNIHFVLGFSIPFNIIRISSLVAAIRRMTTFLLASEIPRYQLDKAETFKIRVAIEKATVETSNGKIILKDVNVDLKNAGLVGITGCVGSGKSTLLKLILNDVLASKGKVTISGLVSYASQEPWIFPGTIKQNILFGADYDEERYKTIIKICALKKDIQRWPNGDNFIVIDRGLNISRGQQARVNLARAVYKKADIYLLDDSLSALDRKVSKHVFYECIKNFLQDKLCVMVTHNSSVLKEATRILYMKMGEIVESGTFQELENYGIQFGDTVDNFDSTNSENVDECQIIKENENFENCNLSKIPVDTDITTTKIYNENHQEGEVQFSIYVLYFRSLGGFKLVPIVLIIFMLTHACISYFDKFVSKWTDLEQNRTSHYLNHNRNASIDADLEEQHIYTMKMYTVLILLTTTLSVLMLFTFFTLSTRASRKIHAKSFRTIMKASMSFFDLNLAGTILNRFSKDINIIDEWLPYTFLDCLRIFFIVIGIGINITSVKLIFIIPTIIFGIILYSLKYVYIKSGRSLQRLDCITRAPVIGHLNASINGLSTIRASGVQEILIHQFDKHQDLNFSTVYMFTSSLRAFQFFMDMLCGVYIAAIILIFLIFQSSETLAGQVGLAITQAFSLSGILQWGIRQWSQMEVRLTSVERVMEYTKVKQEDHSGEVPPNWPSKGKLEYRNVSMCYTSSTKPVLRNISFIVQSKEKIGIIGRTGAGKSSILSALFRLYDIEGSVIIDDKDINGINIDIVRQNISIIPQDPTLFTGTLRSNLDPYNQHKDDELWKILKEVQLENVVSTLDSPILENGANFSIGQRQLICLARAIIRNNKILVLDEATASVDPKTNDLIQEIIERMFKDCTLLTIAHRINTVMKCDKVMVIDAGTIVEFDTPAKLLEDPNGLFYNFAETSTTHL